MSKDWRTEGLMNFGMFQPFFVEGKYDIPVISPEFEPPSMKWLGYNYARGLRSGKDIGVHFFLDDYQFSALWNNPKQTTDGLLKFGAVMSPDFSTYTDMPMILQIYNHYRKHWLAQYWQSLGVTVIPTISWSDRRSFEWCFDGEPIGAVVAISTVGCERDKEVFGLFSAGYSEMLDRLKPAHILAYGKRFDFMTESITVIEPFYKQMEERTHNGRKRSEQRRECVG